MLSNGHSPSSRWTLCRSPVRRAALSESAQPPWIKVLRLFVCVLIKILSFLLDLSAKFARMFSKRLLIIIKKDRKRRENSLSPEKVDWSTKISHTFANNSTSMNSNLVSLQKSAPRRPGVQHFAKKPSRTPDRGNALGRAYGEEASKACRRWRALADTKGNSKLKNQNRKNENIRVRKSKK